MATLSLKYDTSGVIQWNKNTLSSYATVFKSAALDQADNIYITGTTSASMFSFSNIATEKLDNTGAVQWTETYDGPAHFTDAPSEVTVSENGNVYVCGQSHGNYTGNDFTTIKYSQCLSTAPLLRIRTTDVNGSVNTLDTLNENSFIKVIPNPNNGNMHVSYNNTEKTTGTFNVYNIMGKQVLSYPLNVGTNTLIISRTDLDPGIYFYRAIAGNKLLGKDKIVIIK